MAIDTLIPGQRIKLHSTYGQMIIGRDCIIKNGHKGTVVETRSGRVQFDGIHGVVSVPKHWMEFAQ